MTDMEGVSGIVVWDQVNAGAPMFEEGRRLYTEEINAAVRGARAGGASEVVVVDCHGAGGDYQFNSLIPELLHPDCEWVAHHAWGRYTELLERGCDACLLVGQHARANTPDGVMCHTISTTHWRNVWFGDDCVGEVGINAAVCGAFGCPVLLVTGDDATCREARELLGEGLTTVAVKHGLTRYSARQIPPVRARQMIEAGARRALANLSAVKAYRPGGTIRIELGSVEAAGKFMGRAGVEVRPPLEVISTAPTWQEAWDQVWSFSV
jgi:D-amino peptidase